MEMESVSTKPQGSNSAKSKSEREIQTEILLAFGALPWLRIWRQNTGKAYGYSTVKAALAQLLAGRWRVALDLLKHAQLVTFGTPGQADIQGILPYGYVGRGLEPKKLGRFIAIEVKALGGRQSPEQEAWQAMFEGLGGLYILAYSVEDVRAALRAEGFEA